MFMFKKLKVNSHIHSHPFIPCFHISFAGILGTSTTFTYNGYYTPEIYKMSHFTYGSTVSSFTGMCYLLVCDDVDLLYIVWMLLLMLCCDVGCDWLLSKLQN